MARRDYLYEDERVMSRSYGQFADPGGRSALRARSRSNPRNLPCPSCGDENVLTAAGPPARVPVQPLRRPRRGDGVLTMEFTLTVHTEDDAFQPDPAAEITRILRVLAVRVSRYGLEGNTTKRSIPDYDVCSGDGYWMTLEAARRNARKYATVAR
ncbi:MAG: hypothetical protein H0U59_10945 [Gemmatimonadaceae bacterium]|nr:hypothetical protein [Gemmatimonadaceae bacterium]